MDLASTQVQILTGVCYPLRSFSIAGLLALGILLSSSIDRKKHPYT